MPTHDAQHVRPDHYDVPPGFPGHKARRRPTAPSARSTSAACRRVLERALRAGLAAMLLFAASVVCLDAYVLLATSDARSGDVGTAPRHTYAIVLGAGINPDGVPGRELEERLQTVRALYVQGRVRRIVASGLTAGNYNEPRAMAAWLISHGIAPKDVVLDGGGYRTAASLANAAKLGIGSALIVSQGYHLPRAIYFARHAGVSAVGCAARARPKDAVSAAYICVREAVARAEAVLEVALRGVRS
jgi:vancomycin permeability regulator SanA